MYHTQMYDDRMFAHCVVHIDFTYMLHTHVSHTYYIKMCIHCVSNDDNNNFSVLRYMVVSAVRTNPIIWSLRIIIRNLMKRYFLGKH